MLLQILIVVVLSAGAVVSIYDPQNVEKTKSYHRDPHIARALEQYHHRHASYVRDPIESRAPLHHPRLSSVSASYQHGENVERHANYGRPSQNYANNIDDNYSGCPSGFTGLLPYPYDCRRFVNCWKGRAYIQTCGPGTVFNGETMECDNPTKVVCKGLGGNAIPSQEPPQPERLGRVQQGDTVSCPAGYSGLLPHPHDCSKFLNCASGTMHIQSCGPQTVFNPRIKACDFAHKVDCVGSGNRSGKTFEIFSRENQIINQEEPQRKGWSHNHHHHRHHEHAGSPPPLHHNHNHNCTHAHSQPAPTPGTQVPVVHRDRWVSMNRTRPSAPGDRPATWQKTGTSNTEQWGKTTPDWTPIPATTKVPHHHTWQNHGSSWTSTNIGNSLTPTTTPTINIYYAQPVDDDQPSEEVFTNISGADVSEVSLPRRNVSRGVFIPNGEHSNPPPQPSQSSPDAISIPNMHFMPPHLSPSNDDRQFPIPEQFPDYSSPNPSHVVPRKPQINPWTVSPSRTQDHWPSIDENHPSMDAISIPNMNLMPPHPSPPNDNRQFQIPEQFPDYSSPRPSYVAPQKPQIQSQNNPRPVSDDHWPSTDENNPTMDMGAINIPSLNLMPPHRETPNWPSFSVTAPTPQPPRPSFSVPASSQSPPVYEQFPPYPPQTPKPPGHPQNPNRSSFSTPSGSRPAPNQPPSITTFDESNLYGGLLPPLPSTPEEPPGKIDFTPLPTPSTPTPPFRPSFFTTPPATSTKTNVQILQIYPPPSVQNATTRIRPHPLYSPSYSGVAHSRNTTWSPSPPIKTAASRTTPSPRSLTPEHNFEPEIIFSHDGGVVIPSTPTTTIQHHGVSPPSYNREFYKQTAPSSFHQTPSEVNTSEDAGQLPISEAIRLLLRPYFNRSGTVTGDMASKAESHIMNLSRSAEPSTTITTPTTNAVASEPRQDVEIVFAGEQNYMTPNYVHPHHSQAPSPSKYHQNQHHDRNFHRTHPRLPNPFANEPPGEEHDTHILTTPKTFHVEETTISPEVRKSPSVNDVCQFDCGNDKCIKAFEICDGVNNCGNRKDEEKCDHLGYEIRLSGEGSGRVEVKILGHWGYVCDDKFGIHDANVVCRELGFPLGASEVHGNSFYPPADGEEVSFVMDEVDCIGNETSLKNCGFMGWGVSDCGPDEIVGVQCKTPVMTCPNDYWLCSTSKECIPPAFVCDNVPDCSDKSDESEAICNSTIEYRLKGGRTKQEGRLEVLYRGVWGTVCDDDFGQTEAQVACNALGHYGRAKIVKNAFGPGSGPIWLDQVSCYGNESTIDTCNHWSWGEHNCNHTEDVSLKCTTGVPPSSINKGVKGSHNSFEDVQTTTLDDIGMDIYPMQRSSKFVNTRKVCGHFNANLTEELPLELERVVKGNVAKRGHHPWQATIRTKGRGGISSHWCGAVLISKKHILTAAHCLAGYPKGAYFIRLGDHYANIAESSEIDSYIENWYIHEQFREGTHMNNDIALIVMKNPVRFNDYIQPICLPQEGTDYEEGRRCTISGWGSIQSGVSTPSNNLRVAEIPVISGEVCKLPHVYGNSITQGMFCAGYLEEGVDACEGDSGGPFVCSDEGAETLYGIISWGQQCGHANKPGVYVKIEKYLDWIYEKIRFSMQQT